MADEMIKALEVFVSFNRRDSFIPLAILDCLNFTILFSSPLIGEIHSSVLLLRVNLLSMCVFVSFNRRDSFICFCYLILILKNQRVFVSFNRRDSFIFTTSLKSALTQVVFVSFNRRDSFIIWQRRAKRKCLRFSSPLIGEIHSSVVARVK